MKRYINVDNFIKNLGLDTEEAREENLGEIVTLEDIDRQRVYTDEQIVNDYKNNILEELSAKAFERYGNDSMGGQMVVALDDIVDVIRKGKV